MLWGFIHGGILVLHRLYGNLRKRNPDYRPAQSKLSEFVSIAAMQYFVLLAWIAFRVSDTSDLKVALSKFVFFDFDFGLANISLGAISFFSSLLIMAVFAALHITSARVGQLDHFLGRASLAWACVTCVIVGFTACLLWPMSDAPFIYFQF